MKISGDNPRNTRVTQSKRQKKTKRRNNTRRKQEEENTGKITQYKIKTNEIIGRECNTGFANERNKRKGNKAKGTRRL